MNRYLKNYAILLFPFTLVPVVSAQVTITVDPFSTLAIEGESELKRERYFSISDQGVRFDQRVGSAEGYEYLVDYLNIALGRNLGPVRSFAKNPNFTKEDPARPGFADLTHLEKKLKQRLSSPSEKLLKDFGPNMNIAAHGQIRAYPDFMGLQSTTYLDKGEEQGKHGKPTVPANIKASAELAAAVLKYGYHDLTRPRYFEPINEPHWSYLNDPAHLAAWHLEMHSAISQSTPGVLVGGPCVSVGYFANKNYHPFKGLQAFMHATKGQLDFYSFHAYDYYRWEENEFHGSILSGLPLEGSLDLVANYTLRTFGKISPIVISEHGGYASPGGDSARRLAEKIASERFPGSGFDWQMKARSLHEFILLNSVIGNTLAFMDHPHMVLKAVPFILLESSGWDPLYYACLLVKKDFDPKATEYVPSTLSNFYKLFRDLDGRRVWSHCPDPDIQVRSFAKDNKLFIVAHNLADKEESLSLNFPRPQSAVLRRFGRHEDKTPFLKEQPVSEYSALTLKARETAILVATYESSLKQTHSLNQSIHYGDQAIVPVTKEKPAVFTISVSNKELIKEASLRIGLNRAANLAKDIALAFNGTAIPVPVEDSAGRITSEEHGYSTCKIINIDPELLKESNEISISFPDGQPGTIGSAVLRVTRKR